MFTFMIYEFNKKKTHTPPLSTLMGFIVLNTIIMWKTRKDFVLFVYHHNKVKRIMKRIYTQFPCNESHCEMYIRYQLKYFQVSIF